MQTSLSTIARLHARPNVATYITVFYFNNAQNLIMPALFCSLLLPSYFSKNYAGKISASLATSPVVLDQKI